MIKRIVTGFCTASLISSAAVALEIPVEGLGRYDVFRTEMLRAGWSPVEQPHPHRYPTASGDWITLPEVQCGNRICMAVWTDGDRTIEVTLWRDEPLRLGLHTTVSE